MTELRERVLDATYEEVADHGLGALTVEAVATRAGSSRATIYRHFPGGRDELIETTLRREVARYFDTLLASAADTSDLVDHVADLVVSARQLLGHHEVLQRLLVDEAEAIVPPLATVEPMILATVADHLRDTLGAAEVPPGVDVDFAADHGARMFLSYVAATGGWDLDDRAAVERLVRTRILVGVVEPGTGV